MSGLDQEIGKRLRKARKLRGYKSARAFAIEHKIPESTYSQHETGKRSLSPEIVLRYCDCLAVDPGWLLSGREAGMSFSGNATSVAEVSLRTSNRQAGSQHNKNASMMITDNLITMDMDIFKGVLKKAIQKYLGSDISVDTLEDLMKYCEQTYGLTKVSSDFQVKDGDSIVSN